VAAVVVTNGTQSASQITLHGLSFGKVAFHGNGAKTSIIFLGAAEDFVLSANFRRIGLQHTLSNKGEVILHPRLWEIPILIQY
jgi:hypothetical protein